MSRDDTRAKGATLTHVFERFCAKHNIEHRPTKPYPLDRLAERTVRTSIDDVRRQVRDWLPAYHYAKQRKALRVNIRLKRSSSSA